MIKPAHNVQKRSGRLVRLLLTGILCCATSCQKKPEESGQAKDGGFPGYTLVQQLATKATNLIDAKGRVVHRWMSQNSLGGGTYLLENGNLLRSSIPTTATERSATPGLSGMVELLDWEGNQLWSYTRNEETNCLHHDIEPLPNGNILMLALDVLSIDEQTALGRDPARAKDVLKLDCVLEIKPEGKVGGQIVWEWNLKDHLIQDFDKTKKNYGVVSQNPGKVDINFIENLMKSNASSLRVMQSLGYVASTAKITPQRTVADWTHANSVTYHPGLDQILISVRSLSEIWIIDHGTTTAEAATGAGGKMKKGGDLLYRWGNPQSYQSGSPADQQLYGQHDAQWIKPGTPGEGNILIFNNGEGRKEGEYSSNEEITPPLKADGSYEWMEGEAYGPTKPAWQYVAAKKEEFFSSFLSGVQRLPNGNTLICSGAQGRMFEVTRDGNVAWEHKMEISIRGAPGSMGPRPGMAGGPGAGKGPGVGPGTRRPGKGPGGGVRRPGMRPGTGAAQGAQGTGGTGQIAGQDGSAAAPAEGDTRLTPAEMAILQGPDSLFATPPPGAGAGAGAGASFPGGRPGMGPGRGMPGRPGGGGPGGGGLFRATRYGLDYPAFEGRKLEPIGLPPETPAK